MAFLVCGMYRTIHGVRHSFPTVFLTDSPDDPTSLLGCFEFCVRQATNDVSPFSGFSEHTQNRHFSVTVYTAAVTTNTRVALRVGTFPYRGVSFMFGLLCPCRFRLRAFSLGTYIARRSALG